MHAGRIISTTVNNRHPHTGTSGILRALFLALAVLLLSATNALAVEGEKKPTVADLIDEVPEKNDKEARDVTVTKAIPKDDYDRGTPRSSILGLADALTNRDYERGVNYLDMRNVPAYIRANPDEILRELKIIADRSLWVDVETISEDPEGHKDDDLPSYRDIIARLKTPDGVVDILVQRVPDGKGGRVWKLSNKTVAEIPRLYEHFGYGEIGDRLSRMLPEVDFMGLVLWQWVMLIGIALGAYIISWIITRLFIAILRLRKRHTYPRIQTFAAGPLKFLVFILIVRANFELIAPSLRAQALFDSKTVLILAVTWLFTGLVDLGFGRLGDRMKEAGNAQATVLLRPAASLVKVIILLVAIISWLDNLGFNVSAMLAGLGVGGIAVGLAAQKSIENLIGAITLYAAQPVRIGDFCKAGSTLGVVEEIGLRSTTLRTLDRTLVTVPNARFANMEIENLTMRDKILYRRNVRLRNDTSPDQVRAVLDGVRSMFALHDEVDSEPARIRFIEYGEDAFKLEIFAYIKTTDYNEYLASVEDLNLRILDIVAAAGTQLAVPARSIRLEGEAAPA
jgi:MscS family membrane protein